jgi:hypothetical protein
MELFHTRWTEFNRFYPPFVHYQTLEIRDDNFIYNNTKLSCPLSIRIDEENSCSSVAKYNETVFTSSTTRNRESGLRIHSRDIYQSNRETEDHGIYYIEFELEMIKETNDNLNLLNDWTAYFMIPMLIMLPIIRKKLLHIE